MTKIYCYAEQCAMGGRVVANLDRYTNSETGEVDSYDVFLWGEGTDDELRAEAEAVIAKQTGGPSFAWKCARNVLNSL
jgi:hypothetical protein